MPPRNRARPPRVIASILVAGAIGLAPCAAANGTSDALRAQAFELAYNLDYDEAIATLRRAVEIDPSDPATHRSLAAVTWLNILFRRGAVTVDHYSGSIARPKVDLPEPPPQLAATFRAAADRAIALAEERVRRHPTDVQAVYELGSAIGLRASYLATVDGELLAGFKAARRAYDAHEKVLELAPARKDAGLIVGTYRYLVSTFSLPVRWLAYMVGFGGGRDRGLALIEEAAASDSDARVDAQFALILLYNREGRYGDALRIIDELKRRYPRNRLIWLEAGATSLRAGRQRAAEEILTEGLDMLARDTRPRIPGEEALWHYKRGAARVASKRLSPARDDLQRAVTLDGPAWITGRAYVELGKVADLEGDRRAAIAAYDRAIPLLVAGEDPAAADAARRLKKSAYRGDSERVPATNH